MEDLVKAIADLEEEEALRITIEKLEASEDPSKILEDSRKALEIVGKRFADNRYFIPDLVYFTKSAPAEKLLYGKTVFF